MPTWALLLTAAESLSLPVIGFAVLAMSKLAVGPTARLAERWFLGILFAVTLITCQTVISSGPCWFAHTATLGLMIIGALLVPNRDAIESRRIVTTYR